MDEQAQFALTRVAKCLPDSSFVSISYVPLNFGLLLRKLLGTFVSACPVYRKKLRNEQVGFLLQRVGFSNLVDGGS